MTPYIIPSQRGIITVILDPRMSSWKFLPSVQPDALIQRQYDLTPGPVFPVLKRVKSRHENTWSACLTVAG